MEWRKKPAVLCTGSRVHGYGVVAMERDCGLRRFSRGFGNRPMRAMCCGTSRLLRRLALNIPKPSEEAPFDLGTIPATDVAKCTFRIITPMNAEGVAVGNAYKCEPSGGAWKIFVDKTTPLATLKFQKDHLLFQWEHGVGRSAAAGVRNCLLQVGYGDARKFFTLRKAVRAASQAVDLRHDSTAISPDIEDLPEARSS